ncbi:hypothetical protein [Rhizobium sp. SSA_523]|uniref:hypothetical protein n=1 Tax=Rhizobium sp. SSA_523 TaxID=2952477 RepID=UPI00209113AA|nr:hypothetical protein [Rhizobium sp. SSA_523]MCO5734883.1 hypothetical protein [Rhizobium sp. SSA_523]WKC24787.1 hypothetical protein QTJ18_12235 [Rhizobium sp. SSA_523]
MDVELDVRQLFYLSEGLDAHNVPHVFVTDRVASETGFCLNDKRENTSAIVTAIIFQNDDGRRH